MECGKRIKCTAKAFSPGKQGRDMKGILLMTSVKVKVYSPGAMAANMTDSGKMVNSTVRESSSNLVGQEKLELGRLVKILVGIMSLRKTGRIYRNTKENE